MEKHTVAGVSEATVAEKAIVIGIAFGVDGVGGTEDITKARASTAAVFVVTSGDTAQIAPSITIYVRTLASFVLSARLGICGVFANTFVALAVFPNHHHLVVINAASAIGVCVGFCAKSKKISLVGAVVESSAAVFDQPFVIVVLLALCHPRGVLERDRPTYRSGLDGRGQVGCRRRGRGRLGRRHRLDGGRGRLCVRAKGRVSILGEFTEAESVTLGITICGSPIVLVAAHKEVDGILFGADLRVAL